ncbi:MAG: hypothetical protein IJS28_08470 [Synergistaceae bacterium]|nr:hypothetical protein [Synergistaceae bacterium]
MFKKICLFTLTLAVMLSASIAAASPAPPAKGQWALPLEPTLPFHKKADINSDFADVTMPDMWLAVPSAVRDSDNYLWYKVTIDGDTGWLPQNGVRLKMGGKSKLAAKLYNNYVKARRKIMNKPGNWTSYEDAGLVSYTSDGGEFRVIRRRNSVEDVFFTTEDAKTCKEFLGVNLIGLLQPQVRRILGTPTMRETPSDDKDTNILSFELDGRNITLTITEIREPDNDEGRVISVSFYRGRTGEPF